MSSGVSAIGSTRPWAPSSRPTQSSAGDVVAEQLPQRDDQQVADGVAVHLAVAGEPVLQHAGPGAAPLVVAAQRGQRHPQVAGRQHAELAAQPARRAAVVGHGDDRGQVVDDVARSARQRRGQAVAAAERDHRLDAVGARVGAHSRPRSRWTTPASYAGARAAGAAISSAIATLRCLPPVQPTATVMNRLPSRR